MGKVTAVATPQVEAAQSYDVGTYYTTTQTLLCYSLRPNKNPELSDAASFNNPHEKSYGLDIIVSTREVSFGRKILPL